MAIIPDATATCQYPAIAEHRLSTSPAIMDLPDDALEEIARRAGSSLCNFSLAHPRFAEIFSRMRRPRIEATHICESLQRSLAYISRNVRVLILMNCHSESSLILSLILQCPHLTELNTVNSGLTTPDLLQSLGFLSELETLSFSAVGIPGYSRAVSHPNHGSLRSIYVEHDFGTMARTFVINLINSCSKIERLRLMGIPYRPLDSTQRFPVSDEHAAPRISKERWRTLKTVIFADVGRLHVMEDARSIFIRCPAHHPDIDFKDLCQKTEIVYHRGIFNEIVPKEPIAVYVSYFRNRMYIVSSEDPVWHYGEPRYLRIESPRRWSSSGSLPQSVASLTTLVELDVSDCHSEDRPEMWEQLFQSSAALKCLKAPLCLLTLRSSDTSGKDVYPLVKALEELKLEKLHCSGLDCDPLSGCLDDPVLPNFTGLAHLNELTLIKPPVSKDFLNRIAIRSMSCLKLYNEGNRGDLNLSKLRMFFVTCKNLLYLKIDWMLLPLHEKLLWQRFSEANLKQLCIRSLSTGPVSLRMIRKFLPTICRSMDVLHIHAPDLINAEKLSSLLTAEIHEINLVREHNPLRAILPTSLDRSLDPGHHVISNFPGRALCCFRDNPGHELMGWTHDY